MNTINICTSSLIGMMLLSLVSISLSQTTHNATPIEVGTYDDTTKIVLMMDFFAERMLAHDFNIAEIYFDEEVRVEGVRYSKDWIKDYIKSAFSYNGIDTSIAMQEFQSRGPYLFPDYSIVDLGVVSCSGQDTVNINYQIGFSVSTSPDQVMPHCTVTLRKLSHSNTLPVLDFVVSECDWDFLESISQYGHNFIVNYIGESGGMIPVEWQDQDWYHLWDFLEDEPRSCVDFVQQYDVTNKALIWIPIQINYQGDVYNLWQIDENVTTQYLNSKFIYNITDFDILRDHSHNTDIMYILDGTAKRLISADLGLGDIGSCPSWRSSTNQYYGELFGFPRLMSVGYDGDALIYDMAPSSRLKTMAYLGDPTNLFSFNLVDISLTVPRNNYMGVTQFKKSMVTGPFSQSNHSGLWMSAVYNDDISILLHDYYEIDNVGWLNPLWVVHGYTSNCAGTGNIDLSNKPKFYIDDVFSMQGSATIRTPLINKVCIVDGKRVVLTEDDDTFQNQNPLDMYFTTKRITEMGGEFGVSVLDRTSNGDLLVCDTTSNLVHVFESYEGRYVCSLAAPGQSSFSNLKAVRNASVYRPYTINSNEAFHDLYTAEKWSVTSGFRRFLPGVDLLNIKRKDPVDHVDPVVLLVTCPFRTQIDVYVDGLYKTTSVKKAGRHRLHIPDAYGSTVRLSCLPASNGEYGVFGMPSPINYDIHPDGGVTKARGSAGLSEDIVLYPNYPNPARSSCIVQFLLIEAAQISLNVYDTRGKLLGECAVSTYCQPGINMLEVDMRNIPRGMYYYTLTNSKGEFVMGNMVKQ